MLGAGVGQGQQCASTRSQTLHQLLNKNVNQWSITSLQYTEKINAIRDWIIKTGQPVTVVDNLAFRTMVNKLDAKFKIPGNFNS
jgi:hypothetical protein